MKTKKQGSEDSENKTRHQTETSERDIRRRNETRQWRTNESGVSVVCLPVRLLDEVATIGVSECVQNLLMTTLIEDSMVDHLFNQIVVGCSHRKPRHSFVPLGVWLVSFVP